MTATDRTRRGDAALVGALAAGATHAQAAERAGVSERTVRRRLDEPDFRRAVSRERGRILDRAAGLAADTAAEAITVLRDLMRDAPEHVRLAAARAIVDRAASLREAGELEERLRRLEEVAERVPPRSPRVVALSGERRAVE